MNLHFLKNKIFLVGGGFFVLLALGVVMGLTIVRIQNQKPTVTQPKAFGPTVTWPSCVNATTKPSGCSSGDLIDSNGNTPNTPGGYYHCENNDCFNTSDDSRNINKCCSKVKNDPGACAWPARGWCTPAQCPGSGGQMCGLYIYNHCSNCYGLGNYNGSCSWQADCIQGQECVSGTCTTTNNPCWVKVPIPGAWLPTGQISGTVPTFFWDYDTTYSSAVTGVVVYLFDKDPTAGGVAAKYSTVAPAGAGASFKSVPLSQFGITSLLPNKQYWWMVNVNSYSSPDPKYACMKTATFTTGTGTNCTSTPATPDACGITCTNIQIDSNNCGACGKVCQSGQTCSSGVCTVGASCTTGQTACSTGCKNLQTDSSNCGSCGRACTTGQTCVSGACSVSTTDEVNACWGNGGVNGKCYDPNGDGEVNILDFSCMRSVYSQTLDKKCGDKQT